MAKALEVNENSVKDGDMKTTRSPKRGSDDKRREKPTGTALQVNGNSVDNEDQAVDNGKRR